MTVRARFLTLSHAAGRLGCSAAWVAVLFDRGVLPGIRDSGGRRLVEEEAVERRKLQKERAPQERREAGAHARRPQRPLGTDD